MSALHICATRSTCPSKWRHITPKLKFGIPSLASCCARSFVTTETAFEDPARY